MLVIGAALLSRVNYYAATAAAAKHKYVVRALVKVLHIQVYAAAAAAAAAAASAVAAAAAAAAAFAAAIFIFSWVIYNALFFWQSCELKIGLGRRPSKLSAFWY